MPDSPSTDDSRSTGESPAVRGVVLAGGASTRFGEGDKALATLDGRPLVAHVVESVAAATDGPPLLSVADESDGARLRDALEGTSVETVVDVPALSGPLAGIYAAAETVEADWLFVCACDMPLVSAAGIAAVRDAAARSAAVATDDGAAPDALVPVVEEYDQPLHALYRRRALDRARPALAAGDAIMALLDELRVERVTAADLDLSDATATLAAATTNVNTREDLDAVREHQCE
jgi:molybdopterin-guanine dinucleotide biosynthesis protein A